MPCINNGEGPCCGGGTCDPAAWITEPVEISLSWSAPPGQGPELPCSDGAVNLGPLLVPCVFPPGAIIDTLSVEFHGLTGQVGCGVWAVFDGCSGSSVIGRLAVGTGQLAVGVVGPVDPCGFRICLGGGDRFTCHTDSFLRNFTGLTVRIRISPPPP